MQIIQITTDVTGYNQEIESGVYGLGNDNKVYYWSSDNGEWVLWVKKS